MIKKILHSKFYFFAIIGSTGFVIDSSIFYCLHFNFDIAFSRVVSILTAMTFTWLANRTFTFQYHASLSFKEWLKYFSVNSVGAVINFSVFVLLMRMNPFLSHYFIIPLALATLTAMGFNFTLSQFFVFKSN